tara:strand:- start:497 stop:1072 length:576 start_codon:yes stop_codon:yes gene_type:complete
METLIKFLSISVVWLGIIYFIQHKTELFETNTVTDVCNFVNMDNTDSKDLCKKKCQVYGIESGKSCDANFCDAACKNAKHDDSDDKYDLEPKVICIEGNNEVLLKWNTKSFANDTNAIDEFKIHYFLTNDTDKGINIFKVSKPKCGWSNVESVKITHLENDKEYSFQIVSDTVGVFSSIVRAIPSNMNRIY